MFHLFDARSYIFIIQYLFIWLGWVLAAALRICDLRWGMPDLKLQHGAGNGIPLQDACLETPMDGGAWRAAVHGVAKSRTRLSDFTFTFHFHALEKEMATHSSVLAWRIPETGEPGGLPSPGPAQSRTRLKRLSSSNSKLQHVAGTRAACNGSSEF